MSFDWQPEYLLGHDTMDDTHREFVACVAAMLEAEDEAQAAALEAFAAHAERHFAEEDRWMQQTAYESAGCHVDEHAAVLKSLGEVRQKLAEGRHEVVRSFAQALADWFPEHATYMDMGLARWLIRQRLGGSPIVIRPRSKAGAT